MSVLDAVHCAVEIQEVLQTANEGDPDGRQMRFRIGINVGDVMAKEGDIFGDGVNVAARLEGLVKGGEICVSRGVRDHLRHRGTFVFEDAAVLPMIVALAVDPGWSMLLWTTGLFVVVELTTGQVIEPWLYGHSTGLSGIAVVVAAAFWTLLWGPIGLLLSMPLTMCFVVLGRHVEHLQFLEVLLGDQPALAPEESFCQRILADDPDEASHLAEEFLRENSLSAYYDQIAIRGLALAQLDVNRGMLDHEQRVRLKGAVDAVIDNLCDHDDVPAAGSSASPERCRRPYFPRRSWRRAGGGHRCCALRGAARSTRHPRQCWPSCCRNMGSGPA